MKRLKLVLSLSVLLTVFGAVGTVQTSFADEMSPCNCWYPNSSSYGVMRWWYGVWTCHVEDCWMYIQ